MVRNKKNIKLQLKKSSDDRSENDDSTIISNEHEIMSECDGVNPENLENVDIEPSLLNHLKNISNIDEKVLLWNRADFIDIKANERLRNGLNVNRVIQSMQDSPFSKYLQDQIDDLNRTSKASISGVAMVPCMQDSTNRAKKLFNVDGKIQAVNTNEAKNIKNKPQKEILNCWTNNVDCDSSSSNTATGKTDQLSIIVADGPSTCSEEIKTCQTSSELVKLRNYYESMKSKKQSNRRKKVETDEECVWKKHNKDRFVKKESDEDCYYLKKDNNDHGVLTASSIEEEVVSTEISTEGINVVSSEENVSKEGPNVEQRIDSIVDSIVLRLSGMCRRTQRVNMVHDIMSQYYSKTLAQDGSLEQTAGNVDYQLSDNKRRRIVRPSQFNDFFVGNISIADMIGLKKNSSMDACGRSSIASDIKLRSKTVRRSSSIEADSKLLKIFNDDKQDSYNLLDPPLIDEQKPIESRIKIDELIKVEQDKTKNDSPLTVEQSIIEKQKINIKETCVVTKTLTEDDKVVKTEAMIEKPRITAMSANIDKNINNDKQPLSGDQNVTNKQKVVEDQNSSKKQKLVEWEIMVKKQKVVGGQQLSCESKTSVDNKVKRKRRMKNKQNIMENNKSTEENKLVDKSLVANKSNVLAVVKDLGEQKATEKPGVEKKMIAEKSVNQHNLTDKATLSLSNQLKEVSDRLTVVETGEEKERLVVKEGGVIDLPIPKLVVRRGRKKVFTTDIDAEDMMCGKVEGRRIKHAVAEIEVPRPTATSSSGPRVKHVSRSDITNLDSNRKKCVIKTVNRSSKKSGRMDDCAHEETRHESSLEESRISEQSDGCSQSVNGQESIRADGEISVDNCNAEMSIDLKCDSDNSKDDGQPIDQRDTADQKVMEDVSPDEAMTVAGIVAVNGMSYTQQLSSLDVYRDSDNANSSSDEEERPNEDCGRIQVMKGENITVQLAHDGGYPVVTSRKAMPNKVLCYSCGSGGDQMIHCVSCAEPFHFFCIDLQFRPKSKEMFICRNCTECHLCHKYGSDLKCIKCQLGFHPSCVDRYPPSRSEDRSKWVCYKCAMCLHCGTKAEEAMAHKDECDWSTDPWQCGPCLRSQNDGHVCPDCGRAYLAGMDTVKCDRCTRLVHRQCVPLTEDEYEVHKTVVGGPGYECSECQPRTQNQVSPIKAFCSNQVTRLNAEYIDACESKEQQLLSLDDTDASQEPSVAVLDQTDGANDDQEDQEDMDECADPMELFERLATTVTEESAGTLDDSSESVDAYDIDQLTMSDDQLMDSVCGLPTVDIDDDHHHNYYKQYKATHSSWLSSSTNRINAVLNGLVATDYLTSRHLVMECLARIIVKLSVHQSQSTTINQYTSLIIFLQRLCVSLFPWIDIDQCMATVDAIVRQYSARIGPILTRIAAIVRDGLQRESEVFSSSVTVIEERLNQSLVRGREEFIIFHSEQHLAALIAVLESGAIQDAGDSDRYRRSFEDGGGRAIIDDNDGRRCVMCAIGGDDGLEGRLIYGGIDVWLHVQCALWSDEVYESEDGALVNVHMAIQRGRRQLCHDCQCLGATITCTGHDCDNSYHFRCALNLGTDPVLTESGLFYCCQGHCPLHKDQSKIELANLVNLRRVYIPLDSEYHQRSLPTKDTVITIGCLRIDHLGSLRPFSDLSSMHLCPVAYKARRLFWSTTEPDTLAMYLMTVKTELGPIKARVTSPRLATKRPCASTNTQAKTQTKRPRPSDRVNHRSRISNSSRTAIKAGQPRPLVTSSRQSSISSARITIATNDKPSPRLMPPIKHQSIVHKSSPINTRQMLISYNSSQPQSSILNKTVITNTDSKTSVLRSVLTNSLQIVSGRGPPIRHNYFMSSRDSLIRAPIAYLLQLDGETDDCFIVDETIPSLSSRATEDRRADLLVYEVQGFTVNRSPTYAWTYLTRKVSQMRAAAGLCDYPFRTGDGWSKFGLDHRSVIYLIEQMIGASHCHKYQFKYHKAAVHKRREQHSLQSLPVHYLSRSRPWSVSESINKTRDSLSFLRCKINIAPKNHAPNNVTLCEKIELEDDYVQTLTRAFHELNNGPIVREKNVCVCLSDIDGRGLFARREFAANELIIEYVGETIRPIVSGQRELEYKRSGIDCYLFCLDETMIIDATHKGNAARFINHSCQPNCYSKVVRLRSKKHILIISQRRIYKGEELTYDYRFPVEDDKLVCTCGSTACRRFLN